MSYSIYTSPSSNIRSTPIPKVSPFLTPSNQSNGQQAPIKHYTQKEIKTLQTPQAKNLENTKEVLSLKVHTATEKYIQHKGSISQLNLKFLKSGRLDYYDAFVNLEINKNQERQALQQFKDQSQELNPLDKTNSQLDSSENQLNQLEQQYESVKTHFEELQLIPEINRIPQNYHDETHLNDIEQMYLGIYKERQALQESQPKDFDSKEQLNSEDIQIIEQYKQQLADTRNNNLNEIQFLKADDQNGQHDLWQTGNKGSNNPYNEVYNSGNKKGFDKMDYYKDPEQSALDEINRLKEVKRQQEEENKRKEDEEKKRIRGLYYDKQEEEREKQRLFEEEELRKEQEALRLLRQQQEEQRRKKEEALRQQRLKEEEEKRRKEEARKQQKLREEEALRLKKQKEETERLKKIEEENRRLLEIEAATQRQLELERQEEEERQRNIQKAEEERQSLIAQLEKEKQALVDQAEKERQNLLEKQKAQQLKRQQEQLNQQQTVQNDEEDIEIEQSIQRRNRNLLAVPPKVNMEDALMEEDVLPELTQFLDTDEMIQERKGYKSYNTQLGDSKSMGKSEKCYSSMHISGPREFQYRSGVPDIEEKINEYKSERKKQEIYKKYESPKKIIEVPVISQKVVQDKDAKDDIDSKPQLQDKNIDQKQGILDSEEQELNEFGEVQILSFKNKDQNLGISNHKDDHEPDSNYEKNDNDRDCEEQVSPEEVPLQPYVKKAYQVPKSDKLHQYDSELLSKHLKSLFKKPKNEEPGHMPQEDNFTFKEKDSFELQNENLTPYDSNRFLFRMEPVRIDNEMDYDLSEKLENQYQRNQFQQQNSEFLGLNFDTIDFTKVSKEELLEIIKPNPLQLRRQGLQGSQISEYGESLYSTNNDQVNDNQKEPKNVIIDPNPNENTTLHMIFPEIFQLRFQHLYEDPRSNLELTRRMYKRILNLNKSLIRKNVQEYDQEQAILNLERFHEYYCQMLQKEQEINEEMEKEIEVQQQVNDVLNLIKNGVFATRDYLLLVQELQSQRLQGVLNEDDLEELEQFEQNLQGRSKFEQLVKREQKMIELMDWLKKLSSKNFVNQIMTQFIMCRTKMEYKQLERSIFGNRVNNSASKVMGQMVKMSEIFFDEYTNYKMQMRTTDYDDLKFLEIQNKQIIQRQQLLNKENSYFQPVGDYMERVISYQKKVKAQQVNIRYENEKKLVEGVLSFDDYNSHDHTKSQMTEAFNQGSLYSEKSRFLQTGGMRTPVNQKEDVYFQEQAKGNVFLGDSADYLEKLKTYRKKDIVDFQRRPHVLTKREILTDLKRQLKIYLYTK